MSRFSANTSAHHLHQTLGRVREAGGALRVAWTLALDNEWGTPDFARRHAEMCNLLVSTISEIQSLGPVQRDRYMRYVPAWWAAVTMPEQNWGAEQSARHLISQENLDMLATAADLIAGNRAGTAAAPSGNGLDQLKAQCSEWLELLRDLPGDAVRENLREALTSQVLHLIWLIDNADTFGAARVAEEANSFVGALASAGVDIPESQPAWRGRWTQAAYGLIFALGLFTTGTELATNAIEGGTGLVKEIVQTVENANGS